MGIQTSLLNNEQSLFKALLEAAPDATVIVDTHGIIQFLNSQAEKLFGYKKNGLLGKAVEVLIPAVFHQIHIKLRENYIKTLRARPMGEYIKLEAIKKDGTQFPVEISISPLQTDKEILVIASIRNISDRKKIYEKLINSELYYRRLFETARDGTLILDAQTGMIEDVNPFMMEMLGYTYNEFIGKQLWEIGLFKDIKACIIILFILKENNIMQ